jgi:hypothetical protein
MLTDEMFVGLLPVTRYVMFIAPLSACVHSNPLTLALVSSST